MKFLSGILVLSSIVFIQFACKKDKDPIFTVNNSDGSQLQLNGLIAAEPGSTAGNTVFVDFSADKQTSVARAGWDLGFYTGPEFRVILNNTTSASGKELAKNDLTAVNDADTVGLNGLALGFDPSSLTLVDDVHGDITKTVIGPTSTVDAENKVYVINRGAGGGTAARDWYKVRILQNVTNGYRLQYAKLASSTFTTVDIPKDDDYNFRYFSFDAGVVEAEPVKNQWDIKWSYTMYQTALGPDMIAFGFSDFVSTNFRSGVQTAEVLTSTIAYEDFSISNTNGLELNAQPEAIGAKWRSTNPPTGVRTDRFYIVKDAGGNLYKVKFLAMGVNDGGTRGRPQLEYKKL